MNALSVILGPLSNIEPRLLHNAFTAKYHHRGKYQKVRLNIVPTEIKVKCESCTDGCLVENYRFVCPLTQVPCKNVIEGEELLIHKVKFEDPLKNVQTLH